MSTEVVIQPEWLTLDEAATGLQKSTKTVERMAKGELIRTRSEPRPGRKPEKLYSRVDIETAKREGYTGPVARPEPELGATAEAAKTYAAFAPFAHAMRTFVDAMDDKRIEARMEKPWLRLDEASAISGMSKALLLREAQRGALIAFKDPAWKFYRASLAEWKPEPVTKKGTPRKTVKSSR